MVGMANAAEGRPRILVTGALAIDYCATYPGLFDALPRHAGINLSMQLEGMERRFGGCAANVAYSLGLLGCRPVPFVFVGSDFDDGYAEHLRAAGVDLSGVTRVPGAAFSSHGFVFTDRGGNQLTGFFSGPARAGDYAGRLSAFLSANAFHHAVLAPDIATNMIAAARLMRAAGLPFLCDPGQCLTDFTVEETVELAGLCAEKCAEMALNRYECATLRERCGDADLPQRLLVTAGADGARCGELAVPAAPAACIADPTGCGDAWRAAYVHARLRDAPLLDAMRAGSVAAAICIETRGTQMHRFDGFHARYASAWGGLPGWLPGTVPSTSGTER